MEERKTKRILEYGHTKGRGREVGNLALVFLLPIVGFMIVGGFLLLIIFGLMMFVAPIAP